MSYRISKPSNLLTPFVKQYWMVQNCRETNQNPAMRIVPSGLPELTFYFSPLPKIITSGHEFPAAAFVSGQQCGYHDIQTHTSLHMFSVTFQPPALKIFFHVPANELVNKKIPLVCLIGREGSQLESMLADTMRFEEKITIIENFILAKLKKHDTDYLFQRMENTMQVIQASRGLVAVESLASRACLSRKQYERTFTDFIGCTPKKFLKIIRFQHVIYLKQQRNNLSLTSLAYACGYFDQAHMINEFKQLSGLTPKQFFTGCKPHSDYFS